MREGKGGTAQGVSEGQRLVTAASYEIRFCPLGIRGSGKEGRFFCFDAAQINIPGKQWFVGALFFALRELGEQGPEIVPFIVLVKATTPCKGIVHCRRLSFKGRIRNEKT